MSDVISQREARRLRAEVKRLRQLIEAQRFAWREWPDGIYLGEMQPDAETMACVRTARRLDHAVVVTTDGDRVRLHAVRLQEPPK